MGDEVPEYRQLKEKELVIRLRAGDEKAFTLLYYRYIPKLITFIRYFTHNSEEADEVIQEIFVRVWEKRANLKEEFSFQAYLIQSVKHYVYTEYTRKIKRPMVASDSENLSLQAADSDRPDVLTHFAELQQFTNQEIEALPVLQREVFRMSRLEGLKHEEIAQKLDMSTRTVEQHIYRALKRLKKSLVSYHQLLLIALACMKW